MSEGNGQHWTLKALEGVNVVTLIAIIVGGASLYFGVDKEIALIKQNQESIERRLDGFSRTLTALRDEIREGYALSQPYMHWPPGATRSAKPENPGER